MIYTPDAPPQFLKVVWKQIEKDGNNVLTEQELRYALKNKSISDKLSHLVGLESKLITLFDEGIKKEEDAACKQVLKDRSHYEFKNIKAFNDNGSGFLY